MILFAMEIGLKLNDFSLESLHILDSSWWVVPGLSLGPIPYIQVKLSLVSPQILGTLLMGGSWLAGS